MELQSSGGPTHFYSLTLCVHLIAYTCSLIAAFTSDWASVTESTAGVEEEPYDRGIIVSCKMPGGPTGCGLNKDISGSSSLFFACFIFVIAFIVIGFFALQLLVAGACVRSLRERNIGIPLVVHFVLLFLLVIVAIALFEASIPEDTTIGRDYKDHTFGLSRYALVASVVLYFVCIFFAMAEYFKRKSTNLVNQDNTTVYSLDSMPPAYNYNPSKSNKSYNNNNNNNNSNHKSNASIVSNHERKFSKRENKAQSETYGYNKRNRRERASTSVVPLKGHGYF